jgi:phosphoribosylamine--glycine ligase
MGAYSPSAAVDEGIAERVRREVVEPTLRGMAEAGTPYAGTLFPGLMMTDAGLHVLEFNARFGDPETQALLPRLESDLFAICRTAAEGRLEGTEVRWSERPAVGVVMASGGYPGKYVTGHVISGIEDVDPDVLVFQAGTKQEARGLVTNGGRVLTVVATGETVAEARAKAYANVERIHFEGAQYRRDVASAEV